MKRLALCLLAMAVPCTVFAGDDFSTDEVNLNVHIMAADFSQGTACDAYPFEGQECSTSQHAPVAGQAFLYIVASNVDNWDDTGTGGDPDASGIGTIRFGVEHSGLDLQFGELCAGDIEVPQDDADGTWPDSGTGNLVSFTGGCYHPGGENANVYVLVVADGSAVQLSVTPDPRVDEASYVDCNQFTYLIPAEGLHGADTTDTASAPICDLIVPTEEHSWGQIKALF